MLMPQSGNSVARVTVGLTSSWDMMRSVLRQIEPIVSPQLPWLWSCKDCYVLWVYFGGRKAKRWNMPFIGWMESEGVIGDMLKKLDWKAVNIRLISQETKDGVEEPTRRFFMSRTRAELLEGVACLLLCAKL